ncbi:LacI family DNA-binding transcriptional regulator [Lentibacillus saliphilus]|uniref:LacI family DNA-binding transcriptional regulator n=1 Tax=Lentibacillus saliphilus TaxID=2737028 RepID=UPI001C30B79F|nr:LacI family DNA-binding transcriptional regulator [Lentibacillus saliphilus]
MVTIKDVAKASGVSPSTVSRVIADNPRISEETKKSVRKAMKALGYHPNISARNLVAKSTKAIAAIMPSSANTALQNPFFPEVLRGIGSVIHDAQYSMLLSTGQTDEEILEEVKRLVYGRYVDGVILLYSRLDDAVTHFLVEHDFPFVIVGKPFEYESEATYVNNDNVKAGREITSYLIEQGHEHIAFVGGSTDLIVTQDREAGYEQALKAAGIDHDDTYKIHTEFLKSGGRGAVEYIMSLEKRPTGLVVSDDLISLGILNRLEEAGIRVPDDISVVSFNNVYLSEITRPALTTVDIHIYELGIQSAKALLEKANNENEPAKRIIIPHTIVHRDSVQPR